MCVCLLCYVCAHEFLFVCVCVCARRVSCAIFCSYFCTVGPPPSQTGLPGEGEAEEDGEVEEEEEAVNPLLSLSLSLSLSRRVSGEKERGRGATRAVCVCHPPKKYINWRECWRDDVTDRQTD